MNGRTHLIWSLAIGLLIIIVTKLSFLSDPFRFTLIIFSAIIGGLFADVDHPGSMLGKKVKALNAGVKHRGFLHSIWAMLLIGLLAYKFLPAWHIETIAFLAAYMGHLLLDTITPSGVDWFYPFGRISGPIKSDGILGIGVQFAGIAVFLVLLWLQFK